MRHKDEEKRQAICDAAIALINANGFADTSMSKIAKAANVSPATLYVYFKNREHLLSQIYLVVVHEMSDAIIKSVDLRAPVEDACRAIWLGMYDYAVSHFIRFAFKEQFANSPLVDPIIKGQAMATYAPFIEVFTRGKAEKVLKDISFDLFTAFTLAPLVSLLKQHIEGDIVFDRQAAAATFEIAWDAVAR
jgi:AcrR family transcriptional regulator